MTDIPDRYPATLSDCYVDFFTPFLGLAIQLELSFDQALDAGRLEKAVDLTLDAEPVLGCRFVDGSRKPCFERLEPDKRSAFLLAKTANEYEVFKSASPEERNGPQLKVCLWHSSRIDHLLIKVPHQVADAGGVKDIAAILSSTYRHLTDDPAYQPSPNVKGSRSFHQVIKHIPVLAYPRIFRNFIGSMILMWKPHTAHTLSVADGPRGRLTYVTRLIPASRVSALAEYGCTRDATLNDLFLAASLRGLLNVADWDKKSYLSLTTTIDMRRYLPSERAGAVANLSCSLLHWPDLGTEPGADFQTTLERVARITRYGKKHWIGFELLLTPAAMAFKVMPHAWGMKRYGEFARLGLRRHTQDHSFTNTGPLDLGSVDFGIRPSVAHILPPQAYPPMPFVFSLSGYNGTLTLAAGAYPTQKETIERFFDAVLKELPV
jgi:NRPS condensation-like uncharacterized protein